MPKKRGGFTANFTRKTFQDFSTEFEGLQKEYKKLKADMPGFNLQTKIGQTLIIDTYEKLKEKIDNLINNVKVYEDRATKAKKIYDELEKTKPITNYKKKETAPLIIGKGGYLLSLLSSYTDKELSEIFGELSAEEETLFDSIRKKKKENKDGNKKPGKELKEGLVKNNEIINPFWVAIWNFNTGYSKLDGVKFVFDSILQLIADLEIFKKQVEDDKAFGDPNREEQKGKPDEKESFAIARNPTREELIDVQLKMVQKYLPDYSKENLEVEMVSYPGERFFERMKRDKLYFKMPTEKGEFMPRNEIIKFIVQKLDEMGEDEFIENGAALFTSARFKALFSKETLADIFPKSEVIELEEEKKEEEIKIEEEKMDEVEIEKLIGEGFKGGYRKRFRGGMESKKQSYLKRILENEDDEKLYAFAEFLNTPYIQPKTSKQVSLPGGENIEVELQPITPENRKEVEDAIVNIVPEKEREKTRETLKEAKLEDLTEIARALNINVNDGSIKVPVFTTKEAAIEQITNLSKGNENAKTSLRNQLKTMTNEQIQEVARRSGLNIFIQTGAPTAATTAELQIKFGIKPKTQKDRLAIIKKAAEKLMKTKKKVGQKLVKPKIKQLEEQEEKIDANFEDLKNKIKAQSAKINKRDAAILQRAKDLVPSREKILDEFVGGNYDILPIAEPILPAKKYNKKDFMKEFKALNKPYLKDMEYGTPKEITAALEFTGGRIYDYAKKTRNFNPEVFQLVSYGISTADFPFNEEFNASQRFQNANMQRMNVDIDPFSKLNNVVKPLKKEKPAKIAKAEIKPKRHEEQEAENVIEMVSHVNRTNNISNVMNFQYSEDNDIAENHYEDEQATNHIYDPTGSIGLYRRTIEHNRGAMMRNQIEGTTNYIQFLRKRLGIN